MITALFCYALMGAAAGVLAGLLGVGGGIVIVPMLVAAFTWTAIPADLIMHLALGTSLGSIMFTSVSSARAHHKHGAVQWDVVKKITPGILIGTYGGTFIASRVPSVWLQVFFALFLFFVSIQMFLGSKPKASRHMPGWLGVSGAGGVIGVVSSLVGIGGGTLSVPFMVWHNVEMRKAIGTSAAIGFPIALAGCAGYIVNGWGQPSLPDWSLGFIYLPALAGIVLVSMFTAPLGAALAHRLPVPKLKKFFSAFLLIMAVKMFAGAMGSL